MYAIEPEITVWLEFRSMPGPVEITVPWNVLRYLDRYGRRRVEADGTVVYVNPECPARPPHRGYDRRPMAMAA